jgi:hypothetical protein
MPLFLFLSNGNSYSTSERVLCGDDPVRYLENSMIIHIASPKEQEEDFVCETHTSVCRNLNTTINGRFLWLGEERRRLVALRDFLEGVIAGENRVPSIKTLATMYHAALR